MGGLPFLTDGLKSRGGGRGRAKEGLKRLRTQTSINNGSEREYTRPAEARCAYIPSVSSGGGGVAAAVVTAVW